MEDTRKMAAEYRLSYWAEIMRKRSLSGESIKSFCESEGIHQNVYFYWQRKLRAAACSTLIKSESENAITPAGWTQLTETVSCTIAQSTLAIEINGCRIIVNAETDTGLITKVCRSLRSL